MRGCAPMYYARMDFCNVLRKVAASAAWRNVILHRSFWWNFISQSKSSKEGNKMLNFQKKTINFCPTNNRNKTTEANITLKYSYSSSQKAEFHPLLRVTRDHSIHQTQQLFRSLVRLVGNLVKRKKNWRAIPSFYCPQWSEHRMWICSRLVSWWLRLLVGQRVSIISVVEWRKSYRNHVP